MIKCRLWEGGDPCSTEEKWGPVLAWQTNPSIHPFDWTRGLVVPVTSTAHKQTVHSQSEGLAGVIKVIESIPTPHPSLMRDTELLDKSWGGKVTVAYKFLPWRENNLNCVCGVILCLIPWGPKWLLGLAGCVMATAKNSKNFGLKFRLYKGPFQPKPFHESVNIAGRSE